MKAQDVKGNTCERKRKSSGRRKEGSKVGRNKPVQIWNIHTVNSCKQKQWSQTVAAVCQIEYSWPQIFFAVWN